ncbi:MAG: hypothetical protein RR318_01665 [Alistipes sp.]
MKRILLLIGCICCLVGCSPKSKIEAAIKDVYGTSVKPENTLDGLTYVMDFTDKAGRSSGIEMKFKDKIDKALGAIPATELVDVLSGELSMSDLYHWDTPEIRVLMESKKAIANHGLENQGLKHTITIIINEK